MKQEESYLSYEEFRKNATEESIKAFMDFTIMDKAFNDFDPVIHAKKIAEYVEKQVEEIKAKTTKIVKEFQIVTTVNSPWATINGSGDLTFGIVIAFSKELLFNNSNENEGGFINILENAATADNYILMSPESFNKDPKEVSLVLPKYSGVTNMKALTDALFSCKGFKIKDGEGNETRITPFSDEYVDYAVHTSTALALYNNIKNDVEQMSSIKKIETQIIELNQYRSI